ncbi:MAG TPA: ABC transporter ATP-binding protein [Anaerolineales bacterium]|nr:ABC transporter ATP-binding protein [Anaerolineales bacterium]
MFKNNPPENALNFDAKNGIANNRIQGLWRLLSGYKIIYFAAALSLGIAALSKTGTYLLLRVFADQLHIASNNVTPENNLLEQLPLIALGFVVLAVTEGGFTYLSGRLAAYTAEGITLRLRNYLFDHIQRLSFYYHDKTQTGELIQRSTSDVDALRRFFADQAIGVGRIILLFIINFIALLGLNVQLALKSIIVVPLVIITSVFFFRKVTKAYEAYQEQDAVLSTTLQENLTGVRVVKAFARQDYEREKFKKDNWEKYIRGRRLLIMHSAFWPLSDILCGAQMLGGFITAAIMAINGSITIGTYLAYAGLVVWLIWPMRNLGRLIVQTSTGLVSYNRVMEIVKQEREDLTSGDSRLAEFIRGHFKFDKVSFEYEKELPVLKSISFECRAGSIVALLGLTGSGKTSLVNLLPRFYEYTSGTIYLDGVELRQYPRLSLRKQIGIVEQEPFLFSRSIRENIAFGAGRKVTDDEIIAAATAAAIHDVIINFPDGYQTLIGEKGVTLSGGQKQRVAIARALLKDPRILILDDSTSSVDTQTELEIRTALNTLMQGRTSFVIAHRVQSIMNADLIIVLDKGRIVQMGNHDELIEQSGIYRTIYDIQTRIEEELGKEIAYADLTV